MCDTMVALGNVTKDGKVLFAKNSDRHPNEPHLMIRVPRRKAPLNDPQLKTTYIKIPQVAETYEVFLLKPSWIWGCEMGSNEFGLSIGNEAVFTKERYGPEALTGMDLARIALERCQTSEAALQLIIGLLQTYGQGGNCGYEGKADYHNAFLIADHQSAWVLETAGQYWAAKQVKDFYCISNCLSLETDFDRCHPDLIKHALERKWCKNEHEFSFQKCYSKRNITHMVGGKRRREACQALLEQEKGQITVDTMRRALRTHSADLQNQPFCHSSLKSVCMHGGGVVAMQTTGSYIASLGEKLCTYWVTGASTPCIAVFKPVWLTAVMPVFAEQDQGAAVAYWQTRERVHRLMLQGLIDPEWYHREQRSLEQSFDQMCSEVNREAPDQETLTVIAVEAFKMETSLINRALAQAGQSHRKPCLGGGWFFKYNWKRLNRKFEKSLQ